MLSSFKTIVICLQLPSQNIFHDWKKLLWSYGCPKILKSVRLSHTPPDVRIKTMASELHLLTSSNFEIEVVIIQLLSSITGYM